MTSIVKIFSRTSTPNNTANIDPIYKQNLSHRSNDDSSSSIYFQYYKDIMNSSPVYRSIASSVATDEIILNDHRKEKTIKEKKYIYVKLYTSKELNSNGNPMKCYPIDRFKYAEQLVCRLAIEEDIGPVHAALFGLRLYKTTVWLSPNQLLSDLTNSTVLEVEYRVRFAPTNLSDLAKDVNALNYLYAQIRHEFLATKIKKPSRETYCKILGLSVTDALIYSIENNIAGDSSYLDKIDVNTFLPPNICTRVKLYIGSFSEKFKYSLREVSGLKDAAFVKLQFVTTFINDIQPEYGSELVESAECLDTYTNNWDKIGAELKCIIDKSCDLNMTLKSVDESRSSVRMFSILDVCYCGVQLCDRTVEFFSSGNPSYKLRFEDELTLKSFVSCVDGYHRLSKRWYFNLSKQLESPLLNVLRAMHIHGPIDLISSSKKLHRNGKVGSYLVRQSRENHCELLIDVLVQTDSKDSIKTIHVGFEGKCYKCLEDNEQVDYSENEAIFSKFIDSIEIKTPDSSMNPIQLRSCVVPSEYDELPELLLSKHSYKDDPADERSFEEKLSKLPALIERSLLKTHDDQVNITDGQSFIQHATLLNKKKVAIKWLSLANYSDKRMDATKTLSSQLKDWMHLRDSTIVKIFGVTNIIQPIGLVSEYLSGGPLDVFLKTNEKFLQLTNLLDATADLSRAILFLQEKRFVHSRIRCHNLLVTCEWDLCKMPRVKLADPFISSDSDSDAAFLPLEYSNNKSIEFDKYTSRIDVWAFGTTIWQIFNYGAKPKPGINANQLPRPTSCSDDLWSIMEQCWHINPSQRIEPQSLARDINMAILNYTSSMRTATSKDDGYNYIARSKDDEHTKVIPIKNVDLKRKSKNDAIYSCKDRKKSVQDSVTTYSHDSSDAMLLRERTNPKHEQQPYYLINGYTPTLNYVKKSIEEFLGLGRSRMERVKSTTPTNSSNDESSVSTRAATYLLSDERSNGSSMGDLSQVYQDDLWLIDRERVKLGRVLGNGTCGQVFKAELFDWGRETEGVVVAAKCINSAQSSDHSLRDLKREFSILKTLNHDKIVKIIGLVEEPIMLIIEYLPYGSLDEYLKMFTEPLINIPMLQFAVDVVLAMEYLESKKIVHRDLAARNVLVESPSNVKLSDFGLAQFMDPQGLCYDMKTADRRLPLNWYSPETLRDWTFTSKTDVWSYGVLLWEMYSIGDTPRYPRSNKSLLEILESGVRLRLPQDCPAAINQIVHECWKYSADDRCSFEDIRLKLLDIQNAKESQNVNMCENVT